jgi:hypothetical protein
MSEEEVGNASNESEEDLDVGGSTGLPLEVEINDRYLELIEDPYVRQAMGYVSVGDEGDISASKTRQKLLSWFDEHLKGGYASFAQSRFRIINYLNSIWLAGCDNLSQEFWWVNRDPVKRLLYIAMVAEAMHRQQYDEDHNPNKEEIPQAVMFVNDYIVNECSDEAFEDLNGDYVELIEANKDLCDVYMKCFSGKKSKHHGDREGRPRHRKKKDK